MRRTRDFWLQTTSQDKYPESHIKDLALGLDRLWPFVYFACMETFVDHGDVITQDADHFNSGRGSMSSSTASSTDIGEKDDINLKDQNARSSNMIVDEESKNRDVNPSSQERHIADAEGKPQQQQQNSIDLHRKSTHNSTTKAATDPEKGTDILSTEPDDPNVVWWDGPDDPKNPMNFSPKLKLLNIGLVSAICFVTPLASSMFAPGVPELMHEFKSSSTELGSFVVSGVYSTLIFGVCKRTNLKI